ncbi:hypothetical protein [Bacillus sp. 2205SS5-2]|uniref:hypothetical protein n=1 Tax=Bacillus sp. 2205SS5-2 TaxID=3109031 RepID=UPI0030062231
MSSLITRLKWLSFSVELFLALPVFGTILSETIPYLLCWFALWHIAVLIVSQDENEPILGSVLGIFAAFSNFFPVLRIIAHSITALVLFFEIKHGPGTD